MSNDARPNASKTLQKSSKHFKTLQNTSKHFKTLQKSLKTLGSGPYSGRDARVLAGILKSVSGYRASLLYGV